MTTRNEIKYWLYEGKADRNKTHMIVVCDTFDWENYPVYVTRQERAREKYKEYNEKNMQRVIEVYSYKDDLESQLNEGRAFHLD